MNYFKKHFPDRKVRYRIIILLSILVVIFLFFSFKSKGEVMLRANNCLFKVEVADNSWAWYQGLSNRQSLCSDCGMLFLFPSQEKRDFVMREMNFPIDIIFIANEKIVNIHHNAQPEGKDYQEIYSSLKPVDTVLEINANQAKQCNLQPGDIISWSQ